MPLVILDFLHILSTFYSTALYCQKELIFSLKLIQLQQLQKFLLFSLLVEVAKLHAVHFVQRCFSFSTQKTCRSGILHLCNVSQLNWQEIQMTFAINCKSSQIFSDFYELSYRLHSTLFHCIMQKEKECLDLGIFLHLVLFFEITAVSLLAVIYHYFSQRIVTLLICSLICSCLCPHSDELD